MLRKQIALLLGIALMAHAQQQQLAFDLASVRESKDGVPPGGNDYESNVPLGPGNLYSPTGGQFNTRNVPLLQLIAFAYRMTSHQQSSFAEMAPAWAREAHLDVKARTDMKDVTKDQLRLMVRSLLAERLRLAVHYEARTTSVYSLQYVKPSSPGPRLRPHNGGSCSTDFHDRESTAPQPEITTEGYPSVCGGLLLLPSSTSTHYRIGARDIPFETLANSLGSWGDLGRPVVNDTGNTGNVDFTLDYIPRHIDAGPGTEIEEPNFRQSLQKQLGLKLESQKRAVEILMLDHIEHPTEN